MRPKFYFDRYDEMCFIKSLHENIKKKWYMERYSDLRYGIYIFNSKLIMEILGVSQYKAYKIAKELKKTGVLRKVTVGGGSWSKWTSNENGTYWDYGFTPPFNGYEYAIPDEFLKDLKGQ